MVLAEYASSHSKLDSILSTIDFDQVSANVEFPEFGKNFAEHEEQSEFDQVSIVKIGSKTSEDNWTVEKQKQAVWGNFEKTQTTEGVPFSDPKHGGDPRRYVNGVKNVDKVSVGFTEFSSSESEEEKRMIGVQHEMIEAFPRKENDFKCVYSETPRPHASKSTVSGSVENTRQGIHFLNTDFGETNTDDFKHFGQLSLQGELQSILKKIQILISGNSADRELVNSAQRPENLNMENAVLKTCSGSMIQQSTLLGREEVGELEVSRELVFNFQ